jgi:hypothetical protein
MRAGARPRSRGWSRPGKRTTDQGRFPTLPNFGITVAGTAPGSHRLPFEPPPVRLTSAGGTLIAPDDWTRSDGLSNRALRRY